MIVVDASAVVLMLAGEETAGLDRVRDELSAGETVHAPEVLMLEAVNALRGLARSGKLQLEVAEEAVATLMGLRVQLHGHYSLTPRVWALRDRLSAYDAAYLATAEVVEARVLLTADRGLAATARAVLGPGRVAAVA